MWFGVVKLRKTSDVDLMHAQNAQFAGSAFKDLDTRAAPPGSDLEKSRSTTGGIAGALDPEVEFEEIVISGRSMLEIMTLPSAGLVIPKEHSDAGIVRQYLSTGVEPVMTIRGSTDPPPNVAVRTRYRGHWFNLAENDLESRDAFGLLNPLLASAVGNVPGGAPILTLPVK